MPASPGSSDAFKRTIRMSLTSTVPDGSTVSVDSFGQSPVSVHDQRGLPYHSNAHRPTPPNGSTCSR
ncbi:hypothetical protein C8Q77DRAFT_1101530 [Trametes polyzona]|nr:hypothetical protein C8Q77DRAFT_1101530 [Trametes polyzona]